MVVEMMYFLHITATIVNMPSNKEDYIFIKIWICLKDVLHR